MTRIILVSGKGGVGKTTVAAATGLACARKGKRTLVLSFDLAHSLSDSFDIDETLFSNHRGLPVKVAENLDLQEIDVQEEMERHWGDVYRYSAAIMMGGGLEEAVAEEVAIMPGMDDIVALMRLNEYVTQKTYDTIILDCPPTSDALRFVSFTSTLDWYARKRLKLDRKISKLVRPLAKMLMDSPDALPDDKYFAALQNLFTKLEGVDDLLRDPKTTSVRLVSNPEKMVMRETQRAFMYFCMYGMTIDSVVINKLLPPEDGFFADWAKSQAVYADQMAEWFTPVPVTKMPFFSREVCGATHLETFADKLFGDEDPSQFYVNSPSFGFVKEAESSYRLEIRLPFASKDQIDISRQGEDMVVRVGTFKRNILLPRSIVPLATGGAALKDNLLTVNFIKKEEVNVG